MQEHVSKNIILTVRVNLLENPLEITHVGDMNTVPPSLLPPVLAMTFLFLGLHVSECAYMMISVARTDLSIGGSAIKVRTHRDALLYAFVLRYCSHFVLILLLHSLIYNYNYSTTF